MSKTIPSLYYPEDITWWQLLFIIIPAGILSIILFTITVAVMATWQFSLWLWNSSKGLSIYSHYHDTDITRLKGADNDRR